MSQLSEQHASDHAKGIEVFVGGLPRTIDEEKIRQAFSDCGEIVEVRMIKDQKGYSKGFCFVRFSTKESAARAVKEKTGILLDGKKIGVLPSSEQETLYFGNLNKGAAFIQYGDASTVWAWTADEFKRMVLQIFPDIESVDLSMSNDAPGQKPRNRGFAFVKFSSHAAASRSLRVGSQPEFRLGSVHPIVQWAEDSEIDAKELAKVKVAFVRNLPADAEEKYLSQLFDPYGKVERVVVSKKGSSSVGFVHFTERSDLERAVDELNGKTVRGPREGQEYVIQVEVARPMEKSKKRVREYPENTSSISDQSKILRSSIHNSHISRELEPADPYEDAVIALPLAVKERLLRILRLGIATRFDIDVNSLRTLKQLPEPIAISVLDQFMISGSASHNKSAYLAAVISEHLVDKVGPDQSLVSLLRAEDATRSEYKSFNLSNHLSSPVGSFTSHVDTTARHNIYHSSQHPDYPLSSRAMLRRAKQRGRSPYESESIPIPRTIRDEGSRSRYVPETIPIPRTILEEGSSSRFEVTPPHPRSYGRVAIQTAERHLSPPQAAPSSSYARLDPSLISDVRGGSRQQASRPQMRFDPYTGEPYKFDPFTGEPIVHPGNPEHHF
ncbi:uncharacterized protein LOC121770663 isoform X1 [Salvia splendens]|uniref:uncharacterized protein LOC121770663 isoform X1 n=1 Tax=Salvia splendens TaxID=180675 RepID=UPI001C26CD9F|nr:uncharacterized protein LOC121770663 isoform X1 [Salvia splendens]